MKSLRALLPLCTLALAFALGGCVTQAPRPAWRFLQREPSRVAILPATNDTTNAGAPLVIDKAWQTALEKTGYRIVSADQVVTYASARGVLLSEVYKAPPARLGDDLHVDYLLTNEIVDWGTKYQVIRGVSVVACRSRLVEARTGAIVWANDWIVENGSQGDLAQALASALINAMMDVPSRLGSQGVVMASTSLPFPGKAPATVPTH